MSGEKTGAYIWMGEAPPSPHALPVPPKPELLTSVAAPGEVGSWKIWNAGPALPGVVAFDPPLTLPHQFLPSSTNVPVRVIAAYERPRLSPVPAGPACSFVSVPSVLTFEMPNVL